MKNWIRKHPTLSGFLGALAFIVLAFKAYYYAAETHFYHGMIPSKIETDGRYYIDTKDFELTDLLRGESCGIAVFELSEETIEQIKSQGLAFFADAREGVGERWLGGKDAISEYKEWKQTPVPEKFLSDGLGPAFGSSCSKEPSKGWYLKILNALKQPESFYTHNQRGSGLLVIPQMKIIIFTFYG
jgi:hypothetical protein